MTSQTTAANSKKLHRLFIKTDLRSGKSHWHAVAWSQDLQKLESMSERRKSKGETAIVVKASDTRPLSVILGS